MVFDEKSGLLAFSGVDHTLQKYLGADNLDALFAFELEKDLSGFAVEKIEIGEVNRDGIAIFSSCLSGDAAEQLGVFAKHIAIHAEYRYSALRIVNLRYLCWHF